MRVQACHGDVRPAAEAFGERGMGDAQGLQNIFKRHRVNRLAQRQVNADQHGFQLVAGQHHADWQVFNRQT